MNKDDSANESNKKFPLKDLLDDFFGHKDVKQLLGSYLQRESKEHTHKTILNLILGLLAIGAIVYTAVVVSGDFNAENRKAMDHAVALNVEANVRREIVWMKQINKAIMNMRQTRYDIVLRCKNGHPYSLAEQAKLRANAQFKVALVFTGSRFIFNDAVQKKSQELAQFDESIKDVCAKNAPGDIKWQEYLTEINNLMGQVIQKRKDDLLKLRQEID